MEWDFTISSFRKIYDYENRKSNNIDNTRFSNDFVVTGLNACSKAMGKLSTKYKRGNKEELLKEAKTLYNIVESYLTNLDTNFSWDNFFQRVENKEKGTNREIKIAKSLIKKAKLKYLDNLFATFETINSLKIKDNGEIDKKKIYTIENEAQYFFISKVLQNKIKQIYNIHPTNRHLITIQLRELLKEKMPKVVIRGDIKNFYESINFTNDIKSLENDHLLSSKAISILKDLNKQYQALSNNSIGIPRGIGISAYIAEYHMKKFDEAVRKMDNLLLYTRFVDDFIAIFTLDSSNQDGKCLIEAIKKEILNIQLEPHDDSSAKALKAFPFKYDKKGITEFSFLGYKFTVKEDNETYISLADSKIQKIKDKIKMIFDNFYATSDPKNPMLTKRIHLLFLRLNMLTRGYYLLGYKGKFSVGIKSSYPLLDDLTSLDTLDIFFKDTVNKAKLPQKIKNLLYEFISKYGFTNGYKNYSPLVVSAKKINEAKMRSKNV